MIGPGRTMYVCGGGERGGEEVGYSVVKMARSQEYEIYFEGFIGGLKKR